MFDKIENRYLTFLTDKVVVGEPVKGLIKWLRPNGLKVCSYVEKIKLLKTSAYTQKCYAQQNTPGYAISQNSITMRVLLQVFTFNHVISVVKCKLWQQTIYYDQCSI